MPAVQCYSGAPCRLPCPASQFAPDLTCRSPCAATATHVCSATGTAAVKVLHTGVVADSVSEGDQLHNWGRVLLQMSEEQARALEQREVCCWAKLGGRGRAEVR